MVIKETVMEKPQDIIQHPTVDSWKISEEIANYRISHCQTCEHKVINEQNFEMCNLKPMVLEVIKIVPTIVCPAGKWI